ncbi:MAG: ABC transporter permease, partial [Cyclobacteriaceae bacterium]
MWVIFEREYLERVKKKSFLIATILVPLIFPAIIGLTVWLTSIDDSGDSKIIRVVDESGLFSDGLKISDYEIQMETNSFDSAMADLNANEVFGVLKIPAIDINNPEGLEYHSKKNAGFAFLNKFERPIKKQIDSLKLIDLNLDKEIVEKLKTDINIESFNVSESGQSKKSNTEIATGLGYVMAFLSYMFVFIYGGFIMQSVLNEKTSKIVEVIVSSVKPFQLMLGKVLAIGAVAITQFGIWILLMVLTATLAGSMIDYQPNTEEIEMIQTAVQEDNKATKAITGVLDAIYSLPIGSIIGLFLFYFLGGFLIFGALFAAVGASVDSLQEAQQFTLPISLPIIASIVLMSVILKNPDGGVATFLTMFPLTSPILMMARIPFGMPPWWQLGGSMILLIGGIFGALWVA